MRRSTSMLVPDDPRRLAAIVERDVIASGSCAHIAPLIPSLKQAAARCAENIGAGIEVAEAWLTLCKLRLLLGEDVSAVESLCLAARALETGYPLDGLSKDLDALRTAVGSCLPAAGTLGRMAALLAVTKRHGGAWKSPAEREDTPASHADRRVLILAGSTDEGSDERLSRFEAPLVDMLSGFNGRLLTGGTDAGVCGLALRCATRANAAGACVETVGYLPALAKAAPGFDRIIRTGGTDHSILESLQMWDDLRTADVPPAHVTLLALGGGTITAQELALAWALGARVIAIDCGTSASVRFAALLEQAADPERGVVLPSFGL